MRKKMFDEMEFDGFGRRMYNLEPATNWDLDSYINPDPHYSDPNFSRGQTEDVFGTQESGLDYVYSDRMYEWDYDKAKKAAQKASEKVNNWKTPRWHQEFLSTYYDKTIQLRHMIVGVNVSNGYSYRAYGFKVELIGDRLS